MKNILIIIFILSFSNNILQAQDHITQDDFGNVFLVKNANSDNVDSIQLMRTSGELQTYKISDNDVFYISTDRYFINMDLFRIYPTTKKKELVFSHSIDRRKFGINKRIKVDMINFNEFVIIDSKTNETIISANYSLDNYTLIINDLEIKSKTVQNINSPVSENKIMNW